MEARKLLKGEITPGVTASLAEQLVQKWNKPNSKGVGLLEGISDERKRYLTAILLENTAKGLKELQESGSVSSADIAAASRFVFPLVRRVWPGLIVNDIVSVQPMTMPVGAICYFRVTYGTSKGGTAAGTEIPLGPGGVPTLDRNYSSEFVYNEPAGTGNGTNKEFVLDYTPVKPTSVTVNFVHTAPITATDDGEGNLVSEGNTVGTIDYTTGTITFGNSYIPDNGTTVVANYQYNMEMNTKIPEINLDISFEEVRAMPRKLKAVWSPEAMEDMKALYAVDAEAELVQQISNEIALEIDQEVINDLYNAVNTGSDLYQTWDRRTPSGVPDIWHIQSLVHVISRVSNTIHKRTFRAPANWIIVSPEVASLLECIPQFAGEKSAPGDITPAVGIHRIGVLANRWTVYRNPYFAAGDVLIGYKGSVFYDTGYVYAPYIPLQATPTFYDPDSMTMKKGLRTRYNKKLVRAEYFGRVRVLNI